MKVDYRSCFLRQRTELTREVPWDDLTDDTDRLVTGVRELSFGCLSDFDENAP